MFTSCYIWEKCSFECFVHRTLEKENDKATSNFIISLLNEGNIRSTFYEEHSGQNEKRKKKIV